MEPFDSGRDLGFNASQLAKLMGAGYVSRQAVWIALSRMGLEREWFITRYEKPTGDFLGVMVLADQVDVGRLALFIPGMARRVHVVQVLHGWNVPKDIEGVGLVNGFFKHTVDVLASSPSHLETWNGKRVTLCGHSAGGAVAELLLRHPGFARKIAGSVLVTFGAPKPALAWQVGTAGETPRYRVFNDDDPVPLLPGQGVYETARSGPFRFLDGASRITWAHGSDGVELDPFGKCTRRYLPSQAVSDIDALAYASNGGGESAFPNHSIAEYAKRLAKAMDRPNLDLGTFIQAEDVKGIPMVVDSPRAARRSRVAVVVPREVRDNGRVAERVVVALAGAGRMKQRIRPDKGIVIRWMKHSVAFADNGTMRPLVRCYNRFLLRMLRAGTWNGKALLASHDQWVQAASHEDGVLADPPLRLVD